MVPATSRDDDKDLRLDDAVNDVDDDVEAADHNMSCSSDDSLMGLRFHSSDPGRSSYRRTRLFLSAALFALVCSIVVVVIVETSRSRRIVGPDNDALGLGPKPIDGDTFTKGPNSLGATYPSRDRINRILNPDGSLAYGVTFSTIFQHVVRRFMSANEVDMDRLHEMGRDAQEDLLEKALRRMEESNRPRYDGSPGDEEDETKSEIDPLAGVTFDQLRRAILKDDFASSLDTYHEPWKLYTDALSVMRRVEYDGRPIQIEGCPNLFIGSAGAAYNFSGLVAANITHIVDVTPSVIPRFPGVFEYMHISDVHDYDEIEDGENLAQYFPYSTEYISNALDQGGKVLVHCSEGRSRSATLIAVYLMQTQGFYRDGALSLIRKTRPIAYPSSSFMIIMERLERSMREGRADGDTSPLPRDFEVVLADGSLAPGVSYSIIRRAVVGEYYDVSLLKDNANINSWDQLQLSFNAMELTDEVALDGPLAGVSLDDLAGAVLAQFNGYFEDAYYPRANMPEALWTMRLIEVDGEPVPIDQDWWNELNPTTVYVGGAGESFSLAAVQIVASCVYSVYSHINFFTHLYTHM